MKPPLAPALAILLLPLAAPAQVSNCETLRTEIEAKIRAGGVPDPVVLVLDAGDAQRGRNVGTCERGSKRIVYLGGRTGTAVAARPRRSPSSPSARTARCRWAAAAGADAPACAPAMQPAMQPGVSSPRIAGHEVRPIQLADAPAWAAYATLDEVKAFTSSTAASVADVEAVIARTLAGEPASPILFAIVPDGGRELVATVGFHTISPLNGTAEITYDVTPRLWGCGLGSAACAAAVAWGFGVKRWHRIQATTLPGHVRSQRILERCGFEREGRLRSYRIVRGAPADYWLYAITPRGRPAMIVPTEDPALVLRPWHAADRDALVHHADNRRVWRNLTDLFPHPYTAADAEGWIALANQPGASVHLAISLDGQAIGGAGVIAGDGIARHTGQFGYWLGEAFWGRGIATRVALALKAHAFAGPRFRRLEAPVFAWNPASMRVLEKAGFVREGVLRQSVWKDGELIDSVLYAATKDV